MPIRKVYRSVLAIIGILASCFAIIWILLSLSTFIIDIDPKSVVDSLIPIKLSSSLSRITVDASECHLAKYWTKKKYSLLIPDMKLPIWGSFRPDIYFGMKTRTYPDALATGIFWDSKVMKRVRHKTAEKELSQFQWNYHDGRYFGEEYLIDKDGDMNILASFLIYQKDVDEKLDYEPTWIQRIQINRNSQDYSTSMSDLYLYFGVECSERNERNEIDSCLESSKLNIKYIHENIFQDKKIITFGGISKHSGTFMLQIVITIDLNDQNICTDLTNTCELNSVSYIGNDRQDIWTGIDGIEKELERLRYGNTQNLKFCDIQGDLTNNLQSSSTFITIKIKSLQPYILECIFYENVKYKSKSEFEILARSIGDHNSQSYIQNHTHINNGNISNLFRKAKERFDNKFNTIFQLSNKLNKANDEILSFSSMNSNAKIAFSSLLGGLGYFYGRPEIGDAIDGVDQLKNIKQSSNLKVDKNDSVMKANPIPLFTCTPSRTVFPRGFMWDEGFHQLVVSVWDPYLSLMILNHWFSSMYFYDGPKSDSNQCIGGWIPREMILGDMGRSRVPQEFITQRVNIANPPTFILVIENLLKMYTNMMKQRNSYDLDSKEYLNLNIEMVDMKNSMELLYPAIVDWVSWLLQSQAGASKKLEGSFRWRGRYPNDKKVIPNTLASGLDDYPRSFVVSVDEAHVDLHSWMIKSCQVMIELELFLGKNTKQFSSIYHNLYGQLNKIHWADGQIKKPTQSILQKGYYDIGLSSNDSNNGNNGNRYEKFVVCRCSNETDQSVIDLQVPLSYLQNKQSFCPPSHPKPLLVHRDENGNARIFEILLIVPLEQMIIQFIPRIGYVNIFPFILQIVNSKDTEKMNAMLDMIENPELLWTDYGLRSIAKSDMFYRKRNAEGDAPYWRYIAYRGPIWINVNFLALKALYYYKSMPGETKDRCESIYSRLRSNLIRTVLNSMNSTTFLWEQYDDITGEGIRGHPFTGWTSLIVNIMAETY